MKLKLVERTQSKVRTSDPRISVSPKGNFYVNSKAMELLGVKKTVKVRFFQDEQDSQSWYLNISEDGYASLGIKSDKKKSNGVMTMTDIATSIVKSFHHEGKKSLKFKLLDPIDEDGMKLFPLEVIKESIEMFIPDPNKA